MAARPPLPRHVPRQLLVLCWVAGAAARGCQLWTSTICQYLEGFDVSDPLTVENTCKGLCTRHRGCDGLCRCVAANYESTCECSIGECAAQRPAMICNQGCPYWEDSCYDLCNCLVEKEECSASETLYVPPPMELAGPDDDVPPPGGGALTEGKRG